VEFQEGDATVGLEEVHVDGVDRHAHELLPRKSLGAYPKLGDKRRNIWLGQQEGSVELDRVVLENLSIARDVLVVEISLSRQSWCTGLHRDVR
jgi:hypothetical protein